MITGNTVSFCQQQYPKSETTLLIDSLLNKTWEYKKANDKTNTSLFIKKAEYELVLLNDSFPLYRGILFLFLSYYSYDASECRKYHDKALPLLTGNGKVIADSFSVAMYNLQQLYSNSGRIKEWLPADSIYRFETGGQLKGSYLNGLMNFASSKLEENDLYSFRYIAMYDLNMHWYFDKEDPYVKLNSIYLEWLLLKADIVQWLAVPYEKKFPDYLQESQFFPSWVKTIPRTTIEWESNLDYLKTKDFRSFFTVLLQKIKALKNEMVLNNSYGSKGYNRDLRIGYYTVYNLVINGFYSWVVSEHKEGMAILQFRDFLYNDLLPNELEPAAKNGTSPVMNANNVLTLYNNLATLYKHVGNGSEERTTANAGLVFINQYKPFSKVSIQEIGSILIELKNNEIAGYRSEGNFEKALEESQRQKRLLLNPDSAISNQLTRWDNYMLVRTEEVVTLYASSKNKEAADSLKKLWRDLKPIAENDEIADELFYKTDNWPYLQYLASIMSAQKGNWNSDVTGMIEDALQEIEEKSPVPFYFYDIQLLYLKAEWHQHKKLMKKMLANMLFFTGRQLKYSFVMLNAEERMKLYEQRLSEYFDIYHELLFNGKLDSEPLLKEKVISQSLSLKNLLADGNLIPDSWLQTSTDTGALYDIEDLRKRRQEIYKFVMNAKLRNYETTEIKSLKDRVQTSWLKRLEGGGMDSLTKLMDWKNIAAKLKPGQVFIEFIRYNQWLSDTAACYGSFIIRPAGKIEFIKLYTEDSLRNMLNDITASPQNIASDNKGTRGIIVDSADKKTTFFQRGDKDKLATLLLQPLWPYLENSKELFFINDGLLNRVSFQALIWKEKNLFEWIQLNQLFNSNSLLKPKKDSPKKATVLLVGGLEYGEPTFSQNINRLFKKEYSWSYLPGTDKEIKSLEKLFTNSGTQVKLLKGKMFPDSLISLLPGYSYIHIASHGFYFDSKTASEIYDKRWNRETLQFEPLFRCGIVASDANEPEMKGIDSDGYLLGYELAYTDLRNCYLVSLSACETGLGDIRNNMGVDGLSRALKLAGAEHLLISLWKVPDQPTAIFMDQFYKELLSGKSPALSLRAAQIMMSKTYEAKDWAAFILLE